jgi:hypothetical protein
MKMKQVCILSSFWKHGWILLKLGMQVSIGYVIMENENRVKKSKNSSKIKNK